MGLLADFFVATPAEALRYANRLSEPDEGEEIEKLLAPAQYKGCTGLELGTLWAILEGKEWDVGKHMPEDVAVGDDEESWLYRFPDELTGLLAEADRDAIETAAITWAKTEELDCDPEDIKPVLADLQLLARDAISKHKAVYLWGCV
ncbi:MAG: hypothetical protein QM776_15540 [Rhodocyclaceae bacterium]